MSAVAHVAAESAAKELFVIDGSSFVFRAYFQSLTDATGLVPPHTELPVYFAVTDSAEGSRNNLSPRNDFMVLLSRVAAGAASPRGARARPGCASRGAGPAGPDGRAAPPCHPRSGCGWARCRRRAASDRSP